MNIPTYQTISKAVFYFSLGLMTIALTSFVYTLIFISRIYIDFSSQGWNDFLDNYSPQLKIAGVGLALFALWMTTERMRQTQDQIKAITDNNRFNNFFKHREEFIKYFGSKKYIVELAKNSIELLDTHLLRIYEHFFYNTYTDFTTSLNSYARKHCYFFLNTLNDSNLNQKDVDISIIDQSSIREILKKNKSPIILITNYSLNLLKENRQMIKIYNQEKGKTETAKIADLLQINFLPKIIIDVLLFAGEKEIPDQFTNLHSNSTSYLYDIGLIDINLY